ncbi:unnamed protein product [Mytilus edulis]|uniref:Uncharacterized protein n=1 Tax=Mytilus edulis TaxID=6550 RepID=A0A8S3QS64_MYTED|nr:unnamed protein product [Mytilus edulis]
MADLYSDADTNTVSLALHRYLCKNIVGTENQIKTTRLLNAVREDVTSTYKFRVTITSGSFGEGLDMRGSDLDMMLVAKFREVYAEKKIPPTHNITYYRMESDDVKAGFTQLLLETNENDYSFCEEFNGKHFLSNKLFKQPFLCSERNFDNIHGPSYNILGIALHLSGDNEAACQAFKQSFEIFPYHRYNTSIKRLSLMR